MYILLNRESLHLLHKHENMEALCNLAWLEVQEYSHVIGPCRHETFRGLTDMELKMLYRNITGDEVGELGRYALIDLLCGIAKNMPETDLDIEELNVQAAAIHEGCKGCFQYVKGASKPALRQSLFEGHKAMTDAEHMALALAKKWKHLNEEREKAAAIAQERPRAAVTTQSRTGGTLKQIIWNTADEMWSAIGSPVEKDAILKLRRSIMDKLEQDEGIKRTSASSELGNWHKARAPF